MNGVIQRFKKLPGKSLFRKLEYACWKKLGDSLIKNGVIYRNGESILNISPAQLGMTGLKRSLKLICLTGFGHSGSGAVADLLSEYDGVAVQGYVDKNCSMRTNSGMEFDFLRHAGGLFDLEAAMLSSNPFLQDAAVKKFLALVAYYYYDNRCTYRTPLQTEARRFLDGIIGEIIPTANGYDYNPHLRMLGDRGFDLLYGHDSMRQGIFSLRKMSQDEFRSICKDFLLAMFSQMTSGERIVLDQIVSDCTADIDRYREYLGPMKLIAVYRDPRDVYATGIKLNEDWIPHKIEPFVNWYKKQVASYSKLKDADYLLLRFENLVLDYDRTVSNIEHFLGLSPKAHLHHNSGFDPSVSIHNVGIYKSHVPESEAIAIESRLKEFCFNG